MSLPEIPPEIWLHIAQFIPGISLRDMISVNSVFFDLAMNERYSEVSINFTFNEKKLLDRLRDPAVAKRVRCLRINPNFTQDFVQAWEKRNGENSWKTGLNVVMKHIREPPFTSKVSGAEAVPKYSSSQQTLIAAVVEAVSYLSNVVHCDVTWVDPATVQHLNPFIPVAWSTFGSNLRKLTLGGDLDGLRLLASSSTHFVSLQELELEFMHNVVRMHDTSDLACLVDVLAPFVNGLSPRLRHLSITSWASLELSSFFQKLTFFPILQQLTIRISFNKAFPHDHSGLTRLLHDQSHTLKCVTLRFNPSGWMSFSSTEDSLVRWMEEAASDTSVLTDLQTLHIYPTMMPAGFEAFLVYLKRSANTLTSLIVRERYLSYDEVDSVVTTFLHRPPESRLKYLRLNVRILSVRVMDLLAEKVPMLERLALIVGKGWTEERAGAALSTPDNLQFDLQNRDYADWKLYDIGIWKEGARVERELMLLLAKKIPSLQSFWGQGDLSIVP